MSTTAVSSTKSTGGALEEELPNGSVGALSLQSPSESAISPRVSTSGIDDQLPLKKEQAAFVSEAGPDYTAPGLDSLHWAGVKKRGDFDQRSVASSMNAEKDDKSIYEEPAVGAVEEEDDQDDEEPEEIVIGSLASSLAGASLSDMPNAVGYKPAHGDGSRGNASPRDDIRRLASSQAPSTEADNASIRPGVSEDGDRELDTISIEGRPRTTSISNPFPAGSSVAPSSAAASPRSPALPSSPVSRVVMDFEGLRGEPSPSPKALNGHGGGGSKPMPITSSQPYQSSLMRRATGTAPDAGSEDHDGEEREDMADYNSSAASMSASAGASLTGSMPRTEGSSVAIPAPVPRQEEVIVDDKEIKNTSTAVAADDNNDDSASPARVGIAPTTTTAAATLSTASVGLPPSSTSMAPPNSPRVDLGPEWESIFRGLLYTDGIDALGRPVVVINADAVPSNMRSSALTYVKAHLEPLVSAGHYVIVFTARKAKLPSLWIMGAYQTLPRPYRKNVQYVILVRPSGFLKAVLRFMRPFVSKKAGKKIKVVEDASELGEVTGGEVTVHHLGQSFLEADEAAAVQEAQMAQRTGAP